MKLKQTFLLVTAAIVLTGCPKVIADFSTEKDEYFRGETVTFINESENAVSYIWDFGDGSTASSSVSPAYVFDQIGTFTVSLTAEDDDKYDIISKDIKISYITESIMQELLDEYMEDQGTDQTSGISIAVYHKDLDQLLTAVSGISEAGVPIEKDMLFGASASSILTAVLCLKMAEDEIISLDDKIGMYMDNTAYVDPEITIRQLLFFQGGLYDFLNNQEFWASMSEDQDKVWDTDDFLAFLKEPVAEPGTTTPFNHSEYCLLTYILELSSEKSYPELLHEYITIPLGLTSIRTPVFESYDVGKLAAPNASPTGTIHNAPFSALSGIASTVAAASDMAKFMNSVYASDFLTEASKTILTTKLEVEGNAELMTSPGIAFDVKHQSHGTMQTWQGYTGVVAHHPETGNSVILFMNTDNLDWDSWIAPLYDRILNLEKLK